MQFVAAEIEAEGGFTGRVGFDLLANQETVSDWIDSGFVNPIFELFGPNQADWLGIVSRTPTTELFY